MDSEVGTQKHSEQLGGTQIVLEHTTTRLKVKHHGLTSEQGEEGTVYIDKDITLVGGDSKRIRLRYKYATRPTIYTITVLTELNERISKLNEMHSRLSK